MAPHNLRLDLSVNDNNILNNYVAGPLIGKGRTGVSYKCHTLESTGRAPSNTCVAIKMVARRNKDVDRHLQMQQNFDPQYEGVPVSQRPTQSEMNFHREVAVMKKCRHPNIVDFYELIDDREKDHMLLVMEYQSGGELKWKTPADQPVLSVAQTRRCLRDVILGLEYLHFQGILHRDLKPANFLYSADRQTVKITDFGVSYFSRSLRSPVNTSSNEDLTDSDAKELRMSGKATPAFLAPELCPTTDKPAINATHAVDIWALGVSLYCLLFGTPPFWMTELTTAALYRKIQQDDWDVGATMGRDKLPTGGRRAKDGVIKLLDMMLCKDAGNRIKLPALKRNKWVCADLGNVPKWIERTTPKPDSLVKVDGKDMATAIASVYFRLSSRATKAWKTVRSPTSNPREREGENFGTRSQLAPASRHRRPSSPKSPTAAPAINVRPKLAGGKPRRGSESMLSPPRPFRMTASASVSTKSLATNLHIAPSKRKDELLNSKSLDPGMMRASSYASSLAAGTREDFLPTAPTDQDVTTQFVGAGGVESLPGDSTRRASMRATMAGVDVRSSIPEGLAMLGTMSRRSSAASGSSLPRVNSRGTMSTVVSVDDDAIDYDSEDDYGGLVIGSRRG